MNFHSQPAVTDATQLRQWQHYHLLPAGHTLVGSGQWSLNLKSGTPTRNVPTAHPLNKLLLYPGPLPLPLSAARGAGPLLQHQNPLVISCINARFAGPAFWLWPEVKTEMSPSLVQV